MLNRKRSLLGVLGVTALVAAGLLVVAPSGAIGGKKHAKCSRGCDAKVRFKPKGEIFTVYDRKKDGHSAVGLLQVYRDGQWHNKNGRYGLNGHFWNSKGAGTKKVFNIRIVDGRQVRYRACEGNRKKTRDHPNGGPLIRGTCSRKWQGDTA